MKNKIKFHTNIDQTCSAWHKLRLGKFTASKISNICGPRGLGKTGETYIITKVAEVLTGKEEYVFESDAMQHGNYYEPIVRDLYNKIAGIHYNKVGFVENKDYKNCGVSPDGVNYENGSGLEIKCPFTAKEHLKHLTIKNWQDFKKIKPDYYWQVRMQMLITGFENWKFISYNPDFVEKKDLRLYAVEIPWNDTECDFLADRINQANEIYESLLNSLVL
ncbi:MAG: hypothetical protein GF317_23325 [Candidatus Lokiarchaeota archaeon]|nr:hypothetical protein [Candidatus Lokiarchaeota archaeon]